MLLTFVSGGVMTFVAVKSVAGFDSYNYISKGDDIVNVW